jgi:hypothetical protein
MKVCKKRKTTPSGVLFLCKIKDKTKFLNKNIVKCRLKISRSPDSMLIFRYTCVNLA